MSRDFLTEANISIYRTRCEIEERHARERYDASIVALDQARAKGPGRHVETAWKKHLKATANLNAAQRALRAMQ